MSGKRTLRSRTERTCPHCGGRHECWKRLTSNTVPLLTVDECKQHTRTLLGTVESRCCDIHSLPFGAGAIWDCYRGFVLRGGAAGAGQRRPAGRGGTGNRDRAVAAPLMPPRHYDMRHLNYPTPSSFTRRNNCYL